MVWQVREKERDAPGCKISRQVVVSDSYKGSSAEEVKLEAAASRGSRAASNTLSLRLTQ